MNPKLQKLEREIFRTKDKIAELQGKLADMESQKVDIGYLDDDSDSEDYLYRDEEEDDSSS